MTRSRRSPAQARCSSTARRSTSTRPARPMRSPPANGLLSIDAPVSGGTAGAAAGTLTFMAGGSEEAFALAEPVLQPMAGKIVHCGERRRRTGGEDLQQHDPRHLDDRRRRGLRARRKARPVAPGAVRRGVDLVRPVLVADQLLPGAGAGADLAGQPRLQAGFRGGADAEGPDAGAGGAQARPAPSRRLAARRPSSMPRSTKSATAARIFRPSSATSGITRCRRRLQRRASMRTRKGRCSSLIPRIVLSENQFRFSGRCARKTPYPRREDFPDLSGGIFSAINREKSQI